MNPITIIYKESYLSPNTPITYHKLECSSPTKLAKIAKKFIEISGQMGWSENLFTLMIDKNPKAQLIPIDLSLFMTEIIQSLKSCQWNRESLNIVKIHCPSIENDSVIKLFIPYTGLRKLANAEKKINFMFDEALKQLRLSSIARTSIHFPGEDI